MQKHIFQYICTLVIILFINQDCSRTTFQDDLDTSCDVGQESNGGLIRHGFGKIGQHKERRLNFLSDVVCGYSAYGNTIVYVGVPFSPYIIDLDSETERKVNDPFFSDLVVCSPSIWKNTVVFKAIQKNKKGMKSKISIAIYDLNNEQGTILAGPDDMERAKIYDGIIVWDDLRYRKPARDPGLRKNMEIFMYDIRTKKEIRVTNGSYEKINPQIFGDHIIWRDKRVHGQTEIFMYTISTGREINISNNSSLQWYPGIWENNIVWTDLRNGTGVSVLGPYYNTDIYLYNITSKVTQQITSDTSDQEGARIYGRYILWNDFRNGGRQSNGYPKGVDVYMYDMATGKEKRVTWSSANDSGGMLAGDRIIWYSQRDGVKAIYIKSLNDM